MIFYKLIFGILWRELVCVFPEVFCTLFSTFSKTGLVLYRSKSTPIYFIYFFFLHQLLLQRTTKILDNLGGEVKRKRTSRQDLFAFSHKMDLKASVATWKLSAGLIQLDRQFHVHCPVKWIFLKVEEFEFL